MSESGEMAKGCRKGRVGNAGCRRRLRSPTRRRQDALTLPANVVMLPPLGDCRLKSAVEPLSLRLNLSWIATGNAVEMICHWGLVIVLAHLGNLEMSGVVVLAFAICAPVNALAQLGLRSAVVTDARRDYWFGDYLALRLVGSALAWLIILGIVLTGGYETETALVILMVGLGELFRSISDILHALLQQHERMDRIAISLMIRGPLVLALLALGLYATGSVTWAVLAFPLVAVAVLFGYDLPNGSCIVSGLPAGHEDIARKADPRNTRLWPRWDVHTMFKLARLTLPLGIVLMLVALNTSIPRYMVDHFLGRRALGVFVSIFYLAMVGVRVASAIGQSAGPRLAKYHAAGNSVAYCRLLGKVLALVASLATAVVLVVALAGGPILGLLYDVDYTPYLDLAVYLMVAAAMMCLTIPLGIAVEAMRRFKTHMVIRGVGVLVLLILLPGMIEAYGLHGVATAMLISFACSAAGCLGTILFCVRSDAAGRLLDQYSGVFRWHSKNDRLQIHAEAEVAEGEIV